MRQNIDEYVQGKTWYWYVPFWLLGLYLFIKLLGFELGGEAVFILAIPQSFNFILHEMAHLLLGFLPPVLVAAAGSFSELLLGSLLIVTAFKTKGYFASLFCALWFMLAAQSTGDYMADAIDMYLPLVSFGGPDAIHDWNFVFTELGVLQHAVLIANLFRGFGILVGLLALGFSAYLVCRMFIAKRAADAQARKDWIKQEIARKNPAERPDADFTGGLYPKASKGSLAERKDTAKPPSEPPSR